MSEERKYPAPEEEVIQPSVKPKKTKKKAKFINKTNSKLAIQLSDGSIAHLYPYDTVEDSEGWLSAFPDHLSKI